MNSKEKIKISACFCDIPPRKLIALIRMRYLEGHSTQELMEQLESDKDREYLATVALLDVKKETLMEVVEARDSTIYQHLMSCYLRARDILHREEEKKKRKCL